ncbi:unnamed protein product [Toxocara canis]|uniref:Secreted protein n=1 Tax=Toxocara canis TaxID=6265 RepID=A0A183U5N3_TOXCA|nr:unnamed protein product [Toxocara canis]
MHMLLTLILWLTAFLYVCPRAKELTSKGGIAKKRYVCICSVEQWARLLGEHIQEMFNDATKQLHIVAYYIKVMSRPLGKHASAFREEDAIWSGVYRERLVCNCFI